MTIETINLLCLISAFLGQILTHSHKLNVALVGRLLHTVSSVLATYQILELEGSVLSFEPLGYYAVGRCVGYFYYRFVLPFVPAEWMLCGLWCTDKFPSAASKSMFSRVQYNVNGKMFSQFVPYFITDDKFTEARPVNYKHKTIKDDDAFRSQNIYYCKLGHQNKEVEFVNINSKLIEYSEKNLFNAEVLHEVISNQVYLEHFEPPGLSECGGPESRSYPMLNALDKKQFDVDAAYEISASGERQETYFYKVLDTHLLVKIHVITRGSLNNLSHSMFDILKWYLSELTIDGVKPHINHSFADPEKYKYLPPIEFKTSCPSQDTFRDFLRLYADDPVAWYVFENSELYHAWFREQYSWLRIRYKKIAFEYNNTQLKTYRV